MKIAAIISEYNPFHYGHKYLIDKARTELGVDKIIVIMSGDFTQRGEPSILPKELRTRHALTNGADLVLLLPTPYATGSADLFAYGAVSILNKLNCVDYLVFGSECGNVETLRNCAALSIEKDKDILALIQQGYTYAKARAQILGANDPTVSSPNNVLGIEYIRSLILLKSNIIPVTYTREGQSYDECSLISDSYLSAKSVRKAAINKDLDDVADFIPGNVYKALLENTLVTKEMFYDELFYACLLNKDNLDDYLDISSHLANRINNNIFESRNWNDLIDKVNAKNYTETRLNRALLHILLNIKGTNEYYKEKIDALSHLRMLGFRKSAENLLKEIDSKSKLKIYAKVPDIYESASTDTKDLIDKELFASTFYTKISKGYIKEYSKPITIVDL